MRNNDNFIKIKNNIYVVVEQHFNEYSLNLYRFNRKKQKKNKYIYDLVIIYYVPIAKYYDFLSYQFAC